MNVRRTQEPQGGALAPRARSSKLDSTTVQRLPLSLVLPGSRRGLGGLLGAAGLVLSSFAPLTVTRASAEAASGLYCYIVGAEERCEIGLSAGLSLKMPKDAVQDPLELFDIELRGDVTLVAGGLELPLAEALLVVSIDPSGERPFELYGSARAPMEHLPLLKDADLDMVPSMTIGLVQPETIVQLLGEDLPLNSATAEDGSSRSSGLPYFLFHVELGLSMSIDLGEEAKAGTQLGLQVPGSDSATFILDVADPYFYLAQGLSIDMPEGSSYEQYMVVSYENHAADGTLETTVYEHYDQEGRLVNKFVINAGDGSMVETHYSEDGQRTVTFFEADGKDGYRQEGSSDDSGRRLSATEISEGRRSRITRERRDSDSEGDDDSDSLSPIEAFGFSLNGWIGYEAKNTAGIPADARHFAGGLTLQGSIPMGSFVTLDGDVVTHASSAGFMMGGNGLLTVGLPNLPSFIEFSLHLGKASAALVLTDEKQMTYFSGELEPDTLFLEDYLPLFPSAGALASGYIDNDLGDAHITIEGEMGLGADTLGSWIGLDLSSLNMTRATAFISSRGARVSGSTTNQIHPSINIGSEVAVEAVIDWEAPQNASLTLRGNMEVFGVGLEDVTLSLSKDGLFVNGAFVTPLTRIALAGEIGAQGPALSGSASVWLGLGGVTQAMQDAAATLRAAEEEVSRLQHLIDEARATVEAERARDAQRLSDAQSAVTVAQNAVNSLNSQISYQYSRIAARKREISSWNRWRKKAPWYEVAYRNSRYAYEAGWRNAEIASRYATIGALKVSLSVANLTLLAAKEVLALVQSTMAVIPVDADPRVASLLLAKESAILALEVVRAPLEGVPLIEGDFEGLIKLGLDYRGLDGTVSARIEGYSLLEGTVSFSAAPQACIMLPGFGEACTAI